MQANSAIQAALFCALLFAASLWDIRKRIIPDSICALLFLAGFLCFQPANLLGIAAALPLLIAALCRQGSMGGGDIKLTAAAGAVLGFSPGMTGLVLGLAALLVYYTFTQAARKLRRIEGAAAKHTAMPLAPFLSVGFLTAYFMKAGGFIL